jgi:hypothetical protein
MAKTKFVLNDQASGYPTRTVATTASRLELDRFLGDGFLVQRGLLGSHMAAEMARAVLALATGWVPDAGGCGTACPCQEVP